MKFKSTMIALLFGGISALLPAGDLPPEVAAKLLKIIATSSGGKVACRDAGMKAALEAAGVTVDGDSKIVWATNPIEVKMLKGKLVVVPRKEFMSAGAGIALVEDGGKPKIFLNQAAIAASGVALSDAIYKVGEK